MKKFINDHLNKLDTNASFYPSMKQPTLEIFGLLHFEIETQAKTKFPIIGETSNSKVHIQPFYVNKMTNTPINLEEAYGKGFTILSKQ
jgi:hypothetical protein